jgi:ankyrin repeat protein
MIRRTGFVAAWLLTALLFAGNASAQDVRLLSATRNSDLDAARSLLGAGADPNVAQGDGMTPLHLAAERGNVEMAKLLIGARANVNAKTRIGEYTPLHVASAGGHVQVVEALLSAGADASARTSNSGVTPLHLAAMAPNGERAVTALLAKGAPVDAVESMHGQTALMFAAGYGRTESVRALLKGGADPAISTKVVDVLQRLVLDRQASQVFRETMGMSGGGPAAGGGRGGGAGNRNDDVVAAPRGASGAELTLADAQAAIDAQRAFLAKTTSIPDFDPATLNTRAAEYPGGPAVEHPPFWETLVGKTGGMSALHHAAREGHLEAARALLDGGADIDQVSGENTSPLLMAALNGQFDLALMLIERGADPNIASSTEGTNPLFAVLQTQWAPKSNFPQPRAQDDQKSSHIDVLKALLAAGADPDVRLETHMWYWEYGLNKMGQDLTGATPFWRATFAQDLEAMSLLVSYGADTGVPTRWPAVGMRERRQSDGRQQEDSGLPWIPEGAPNAYPIHAAAGGGYLGLGAFSVRNVPDQFLPAVQFLVEEHGADVNQADSWGYTPLHYAAVRGDNALIEYLVSKGADVKALSRLGQSPADMARGGRGGFFSRASFPQTVELLQALGSPLVCLDTHFLDTGDYCATAGVNDPYANEPGRGKPVGFPGNAQPAGGQPTTTTVVSPGPRP